MEPSGVELVATWLHSFSIAVELCKPVLLIKYSSHLSSSPLHSSQIGESGLHLPRRFRRSLTLTVMGVHTKRHRWGAVSCEILHLLDVQTTLKKLCDVGVPQLMRMAAEVKVNGDVSVFLPKGSRHRTSADCSRLHDVPQTSHSGLRQAASIGH